MGNKNYKIYYFSIDGFKILGGVLSWQENVNYNVFFSEKIMLGRKMSRNASFYLNQFIFSNFHNSFKPLSIFKCQVGGKHNINFGTTGNKGKGKFRVREAHIFLSNEFP